MLLQILIVLFSSLIMYQLYLNYFKNNLIEGLVNNDVNNPSNSEDTNTYKPYNLSDPNNSLILAQQNAGNIEVLKGRIDDLDGVKKRVDDIQQSIDMMQTQIDGLVQQQADYAQEIAGSQPIEVTGTGQETIEDVEEEIQKN